ncbi:MAG: DUF4139 domain-containing protein [Rhodospirillaceae bacterium]
MTLSRTLLALSLALVSQAASAQTKPAPAAAPSGAASVVEVPAATGNADLTIYNNNFAMVRERRSFSLPGGSAQLVMGGVPRELQPETAFLQVLKGDAVRVTEQIFNFDVLTPSKLLERAVGSEVSVISINPGNGREVTERARVLSVDEGLVLEINGKIHTNHPGRVVFDSLPAGARARPTLLMSVTGKGAQAVEAELSYLTGGLSWRPDYVAQYDADSNRMDLLAWATVTNATATGFPHARMKLIAGEVNREQPPPPPSAPMRARRAEAGDMAMAQSFAPGIAATGSLATYVYNIPALTSLGAFETKQLGLLNAQAVPVRRQYTVRAEPHFFMQQMRGAPIESRAAIELAFNNDKAAKLGTPLPAGIVRVYGQDAEGAPQFMGEDHIAHTAVGGEVTLNLGNDFDLPVQREQLAFVRATDNIVLATWRVTLSNAKSRPVTVRVIESIPGAWEISKESHPHEKQNAASATWALEVPAKGKTVLEYTARITQ